MTVEGSKYCYVVSFHNETDLHQLLRRQNAGVTYAALRAILQKTAFLWMRKASKMVC
jgi:hypothetical protein